MSDSDSFRAAVVRMPIESVRDVATLDLVRSRNAERVATLIDQICALSDTRLIVLPVLCLTGGARQTTPIPIDRVAIELGNGPLNPLFEACRRNDCYVVSTTQERVSALPGVYFHTGFVLGPEGVVLRSPKAQAYSAHDVTALRECYDAYSSVFGEDAILPVARTPLGTIGCLVESEILVPEAARLLAHKGAEIIVHPSGEPKTAPYAAARQHSAYANGVYWLTAIRSRWIIDTGDIYSTGSAAIVRPDGEVEASLSGRAEGYAAGIIDLAFLRETRITQTRDTAPANVLYQHLYDN